MIPIDEIQINTLVKGAPAPTSLMPFTVGILLGSMSAILFFSAINKRMGHLKVQASKNFRSES
jgi:hypothetical protein